MTQTGKFTGCLTQNMLPGSSTHLLIDNLGHNSPFLMRLEHISLGPHYSTFLGS